MSFFLNNKKHDTYTIDDSYFENYESKVILPLIEIYNKDVIDFDFSNVKISSTDPNLKDKDIKINKIFIDYGDGKQELLNERLINKNSTIGDFVTKNWQVATHSFSSEKKHVYSKNLSIESHPQITIIFYNQFNDKFYYCIPYRILYKSFYDEGSNLSLISANTNNKNLTSFTLRERKNNSLLFISSKTKTENEETIFTNPISLVDETDDYYVDDEDMVWNWSTIPELVIMEPSVDLVGNKYQITLDWREKNVNLIKFKLSERQLGSEMFINLSQNPENRPFPTLVKPGIYEYTFDITGINDLTNSQKIYVKATAANPCDMRYEYIEPEIETKTFDISFYFPPEIPNSFEIFKKFNIVLSHKENLLKYNYDVLSKDITHKKDIYSFTIFSDVIPDGEYNISVDIEDVVKGTSKYFKDCNGEDLNSLNFNLNYKIGDFGNVVINTQDTESENEKFINDKDISIKWKFFKHNSTEEAGDVDIFDISLEKV